MRRRTGWVEALVVASLAFAPLARAEQGSAIGEATIRSYCEPQRVTIGEPFTLTVDIVHSSQQRVLLDRPQGEQTLELGQGWITLEDRRVVSLPMKDAGGAQLTQVRWRLIGLEPGSFELQGPGADCVASGAVQRLDPVPATIIVIGELAEGEDEARATLGFRPGPALARSPVRTALLVAVSLLAALSAGLLLWFVRGRKPSTWVERGRTPLERINAIDPGDEEGSREAFYTLSCAVRESLDQNAGEALEGLTDEEWIEHRLAHNGIARQRIEGAAELLRSCERVKYGAESPTRWAVEDALAKARALCSEEPAQIPEGGQS